MAESRAELAILFADISGSTRLYKEIGDTAAHGAVVSCLDRLSRITAEHDGTLVRTIGDEILATFEHADRAVEAACAMQRSMYAASLKDPEDIGLHIGFHCGKVLWDGHDVYGDAVNVAAHVARIAKAGQIITTRDVVTRVSAPLRAITRHLFQIPLKGKSEPIDLFQVIWESADLTPIPDVLPTRTTALNQDLLLTYKGQDYLLNRDRPSLTMGRGSDNDLIIDQSNISRRHAHIEYQSDRFVLTDQSTNGTYVVLDGDQSIFLRRDHLALVGAGNIMFVSPASKPEDQITFRCMPSAGQQNEQFG